MDVHIEEPTRERSGLVHPGFFSELSHGTCKGAWVVGVDVAPGLEPAVELPMKDEQNGVSLRGK